MMTALILATLLLQNEDEALARVRPLIEKLRSDRIEEREEAHQLIRKMGRDVLPALRKLGQDRDPELAARVQSAIRAIDLREELKGEALVTGTVKAVSVVEWMGAESGRRIIASEDLGLANRKIRVAPDSLATGAAFDLGVDLLRLIDLAVMSDPDDPTRVIVAHAALAGKKVKKTHTSLGTLPKADEFCTLLVTVRHVSPRDVQAVLINVTTFPQNVLSIEAEGRLLLSDYASNLRRFGKIVEQLDVAKPARSSRVSVAVLSATEDPTPSIPPAFQQLSLPETLKKSKLVVLAEGFARLEDSAPEPNLRHLAGAGAAFRVAVDQGYVVEFDGVSPHPAGVQVDRIAFRSDAEADRKQAPLFQTRLVLKKGEWTIAGSFPGLKAGGSFLLLLRAEAE